MKILAAAGTEDVAMVYIADIGGGRKIELVESVQPPIPRLKKWVLLISTLCGCPIGCAMCDAGGGYQGLLSKDEILAQIDFLVRRRYPDGHVPCEQFKIQFARMGEPALNPAVLDVLDDLPSRLDAPGLMPSLSTIAPAGAEDFFETLLDIKRRRYAGGRFQFQFSIHSTDAAWREKLIPAKTWSFPEMAAYGCRFFSPGDRKIVLNFALPREAPVDPAVLKTHFDPDLFLIKITPLNPTYRARDNRLESAVDPNASEADTAAADVLRAAGYRVIVSVGEAEENQIGSNCGQYLRRHLESPDPLADGYSYPPLLGFDK
jgi:23S rRNA (adenine2503-C2)-methyltransferase